MGNGLDDDCDASSSDTVAAHACSTVADFTNVTGTQLAQAMDLCQFTTANPPLPQKKWGVIAAEQRLANGANPLPIVIPCHRVIGADGSLTGYGGGLERKRWLLAHEGTLAEAAQPDLF